MTAAGGDGAIRAFARVGKTCWAVGDRGLILRSDDGGREWGRVACESAADFSAIGFSDQKTGYVFGGRGIPGHPDGAGVGVVLRTVDGGKTWSRLPGAVLDRQGDDGVVDGLLPYLHGGWIHRSRGIAFGRPTPRHASGIWLTVTGGRMWAPIKTDSRGSVLAGDFLDAANACLVGANHRIVFLHRLKELPIRRLPISSGAALAAVRYLANDACWAAGENGSALFYAGPARGWQPLAVALPKGTRRLADLEAIAPVAQAEAYLAGGLAGVILHARDGGRKTEVLPAPRPGPVYALTRAADGALLAGGDGGRIWRSPDGGKSWKLIRGPAEVDVLFIVGPADVSILPALVAHAAAGANVQMLIAAMPEIGPRPPSQAGLRGDVPLRSAAAAAAAGAFVLTDFPSVAGDPAGRGLDEKQILRRWSERLDVPARSEMLRQLVAAVRLYRPRVVALGPDAYEQVGVAAENCLVSRLAAEAVGLAADASALPELSKLGLAPWRVRRVFTGFDGNADFTPPWEKRSLPSRRNLAAEFVGWQYPAQAGTSLSLLAMQAAWLMPWVAPMDRPAAITAFRCSIVIPKAPLFTTGLSAARLRLAAVPPVGQAVATGAVLRAPRLLRHSPAAAAGPLLEAAKARPEDPLPVDMLYLLFARLLAQGELTAAADVNRSLLAHGRAHPLFERVNVASAAMAVSSEWRMAIARVWTPALAGQAKPLTYKAVLNRLQERRWRAWVADEPGMMLVAKGYALVGDLAAARAAYGRLAAFTPDEAWGGFAETEVAALTEPARAVVTGRGRVVTAAVGAVSVDGRLDEGFWRRSPVVRLEPAPGARRGPIPATVRFAAVRSGLAAAVRIGSETPKSRPARPDRTESPGSGPEPSLDWELVVAIDADRDTWTQVVLRCDSARRRSLRLLTRLAPPARLKLARMPVQARRDEGGWTVELAAPRALLGFSPAQTALLRVQVLLTVKGEGVKPFTMYLAPPSDGRLLPHRYALLALAPSVRADTGSRRK